MLLQNGLALTYSYDRFMLGLCYLFLFTDNSGSTVVLKIADCHIKVTDLLRETNTYETLRQDPTISYKKVIAYLENGKVTDQYVTDYNLGKTDRHLWIPQDTQGRKVTCNKSKHSGR